MATCRDCGRAILWALTSHGAKIALDPTPTADGPMVLDRRREAWCGLPLAVSVRSWRPSQLELDGMLKSYQAKEWYRFAVHFDSCPRRVRVPRAPTCRDHGRRVYGGFPVRLGGLISGLVAGVRSSTTAAAVWHSPPAECGTTPIVSVPQWGIPR